MAGRLSQWQLSYISLMLAMFSLSSSVWADAPALAYLFPAGGQRGQQVAVRVGGLNLYDRPGFETSAGGVTAPSEIRRIPTVWFEGPLIKQPASQQKEDYPQDYQAEMTIAGDAPLGTRWCRVRTAQGITNALPFVVGVLPEIVEEEIDGQPLVVEVQQPLTINGRIFPRQDIDLWSFMATEGRPVTLYLAAVTLGSPLEALIEVLDADGNVVAEATGKLGRDPQLRFTPPSSGRFTTRIRDLRGSGLQNHVYRLTITDGPWLDSVYPLGGPRGQEIALEASGQAIPGNRLRVTLPDRVPGIYSENFVLNAESLNAVLFDIDNVQEVLESAAPAPSVSGDCALNGRISVPGEVDRWSIAAKKSQPLKLEVRAARLGSPLDAVLVLKSADGKEIARAEDMPTGSPDCELTFTPPEDGDYIAEVSERFASRGGPDFAYRIRVTDDLPGFEITYDLDALLVDVGTEKKLPLKLQRRGGFAGSVTLIVNNLPSGVTASDVTIAPKQNQGQLAFKCEAGTPVTFATVQIVGKGEHERHTLSAVAHRLSPTRHPCEDALPLAVTLPAPFKYKSSYELKYIPRGATLTKLFQIDRGEYTGPLRVQLAERQGRHLQGVTGPVITVPADANEFQYSVALPPWMELGRTSRTNLMITGEVQDAAGKLQQVAFSTNEQNDQLIAIVSPPLVKLIPEPAVLIPELGKKLEIEVKLRRDPALREAMVLQLILPPQTKGVTTQPVTVPTGGDTIKLPIEFGADAGPFNAPLILRGISQTAGGPVIAETPLVVVQP